MSLGLYKKLAALLSVICISVALNGCGPAAETPTPGAAPGAKAETSPDADADGEEAMDEDGTEDEAGSATE
jgi:hypothetical protein